MEIKNGFCASKKVQMAVPFRVDAEAIVWENPHREADLNKAVHDVLIQTGYSSERIQALLDTEKNVLEHSKAHFETSLDAFIESAVRYDIYEKALSSVAQKGEK